MPYWQLFQLYYQYVCEIKSAAYRERMVRSFMKREWTDKETMLHEFREWLYNHSDMPETAISMMRHHYTGWGD
jgi:hypothetical protein